MSKGNRILIKNHSKKSETQTNSIWICQENINDQNRTLFILKDIEKNGLEIKKNHRIFLNYKNK
jgi:hypothetical protein